MGLVWGWCVDWRYGLVGLISKGLVCFVCLRVCLVNVGCLMLLLCDCRFVWFFIWVFGRVCCVLVVVFVSWVWVCLFA